MRSRNTIKNVKPGTWRLLEWDSSTSQTSYVSHDKMAGMGNRTSNFHLAPGIALSPEDRSRHVVITTGVSGVGAGTYLGNLLVQDLRDKTHVILIDHFGDIAKRIMHDLPEDMRPNIASIDVGDEQTGGIDIFDAKSDVEKREVCNAVIGFMYDLYDPNRTGVIGPRFDHAVRNAMLTIMYDENRPTFATLIRCLTDPTYIEYILPKVTDSTVRDYWTKQIAQTSDFHKSEVLDYIVSKLGPFVSDRRIRHIFAPSTSMLDLHQIVAEKKVIILDLSAFIGDSEATKLVGGILILKLFQELRKRPSQQDEPVSLYIDDVSSFPSGSMLEMLRLGRRYGVTLTLGVTRLADVPNELRREMLSVGSIVAFRMDFEGAKLLVPEFHSAVTADDLCMLKKFHVFMKYLKDGNPVSTGKPINLDERVKHERLTSRRQH